MTKAKISEYDAVAANNTDVNGVNIAEGCPPSGMNNMGREIMAALKRFQTGADGDSVTVGGSLVVSGSVTAANTATLGNVDINGGTIDGATIGGASAAAGTFTTATATTGNITTVNATTVDTTNLEVTNIKAKDGTAAVVLTDSTGAVAVSTPLTANGGVVFNEAGADVDFRVEGDTDANLLFVDASTDRVGIGTGTPSAILDVGKANNAGDVDFRFFNRGASSANSSVTFGMYPTGTASRGGKIICFADNPGSGQFSMRFLTSNTTAEPAERMRIDSSGNVLVGTTAAYNITGTTSSALQVAAAGGTGANISRFSANAFSGTLGFIKSRAASLGTNTVVVSGDTLGQIAFGGADGTNYINAAMISAQVDGTPGTNDMPGRLVFSTTADGASSPTERMRIDSSGNLLVGRTTSSTATAGCRLSADGFSGFTRNADSALLVNRLTSDGEIVRIQKDGTTVGSIGNDSVNLYFVFNSSTGIGLASSASPVCIFPTGATGAVKDDAIDLGYSSGRFDDIYATNGTIQTSDRNEKQNIEELTEAETRVAVAAKGLLRKYRWKKAVAEKGDDARIHFGIIAQDLKAAFEAEGLDAGRYAMFIHSAWWEKERVIPAVEAQEAVYETQTDEEGNETQVLVSEAVEAQPEKTVTDTFETEEEAGEGAVRKERMGVRYNELLAFIIAAL